MKIKILNIGLNLIITSLLMMGCSDWTEIESENKTDLEATIKTEEYYTALREWKKTPGLPQIFVWFDNWTGTYPTGENSLRGLPDSVTIASNWGGHPKFDLTAERKADMEYVQKVKGTKVVVTLFSDYIGADVPHEAIYDVGNSSDETIVRPAIRRYAEAIYDAVVKAGYDGFDWDYEPMGMPDPTHGSPLWRNKTQRRIFVEELGYWFGRGSQRTDRAGRKPAKEGLLFLIDGEIGVGSRMDKDWESQYVDYFVLQAYGGMSDWRMDGVIEDMSIHIDKNRITAEEVVKRTIITENFESYASTGGGFLNMSNYIYKKGKIDQQIGGCGLYRTGFDYAPRGGKFVHDGAQEYYFLRRGITNLYKTFYERQKSKPKTNESK